ncbi:MAG: histidine kinase dimerization/phospho-acceptor domain-containing protein [Candidatus Sericytochromatia bacterium]
MSVPHDEVAALKAQQEALLLGLNHELRTPLTLIQNFTQLLATGELDAQQRHFVEGIAEGVARAQAVVDQLLDSGTRVGGTEVPKSPLQD